jgi:hypothetical protein
MTLRFATAHSLFQCCHLNFYISFSNFTYVSSFLTLFSFYNYIIFILRIYKHSFTQINTHTNILHTNRIYKNDCHLCIFYTLVYLPVTMRAKYFFFTFYYVRQTIKLNIYRQLVQDEFHPILRTTTTTSSV